ncbi:MAG: hypothetical protein KFF68_06815 [Desulfosarcina sp.]|nr:hypothetical protein [Desulfosarcina sp.]
MILSLMILAANPCPAFSDPTPDAIFSDGAGPMEVIIFSDYFCPPCQALEPYLDDALTKLHRSGAKITFVDLPGHTMTPIFAMYFLYAANAADSFTDKLTARRILYDIAQTKAVNSEGELIRKLKENNLPIERLDVRPVFDQWIALIHRFGVKSTPTCIVTQPGQEEIVYTGSGGIPAGIDQLLAGLPPKGSNN